MSFICSRVTPIAETRSHLGIDAVGLVVKYGSITAVNRVDLSARNGRVVGILGSNGAGKSSLLRTVAGVTPPTAGRILISGNDLAQPSAAELARGLVGYCPDVGGLIRQATVREHVSMAMAFGPACTRSTSRRERWNAAIRLVEEFDLLNVFDRVTEGFSHGMSRRTSVMLAVLTAQDVLVLDEPFDGVDPLGVDVTLGAISRCAEAGIAVLVSTHLRELLVRACDDIVVMNSGRMVDSGPAEDFSGEAGRVRYEYVLRRPDGSDWHEAR